MKKRQIKWLYGNPAFAAFEVEAAAGLLVARRIISANFRVLEGNRRVTALRKLHAADSKNAQW